MLMLINEAVVADVDLARGPAFTVRVHGGDVVAVDLVTGDGAAHRVAAFKLPPMDNWPADRRAEGAEKAVDACLALVGHLTMGVYTAAAAGQPADLPGLMTGFVNTLPPEDRALLGRMYGHARDADAEERRRALLKSLNLVGLDDLGGQGGGVPEGGGGDGQAAR